MSTREELLNQEFEYILSEGTLRAYLESKINPEWGNDIDRIDINSQSHNPVIVKIYGEETACRRFVRAAAGDVELRRKLPMYVTLEFEYGGALRKRLRRPNAKWRLD